MAKKKAPTHLKRPVYPGGKDAFVNFLREHLKYPLAALENKIEGSVLLEYKVEASGEISEIRVIHGLGYGCDEEAIRVLKMMKYLPAQNKGVRVSTIRKIPIKFRLPKPAPLRNTQKSASNTQTFQYNFIEKKASENNAGIKKKSQIYNYSININ